MSESLTEQRKAVLKHPPAWSGIGSGSEWFQELQKDTWQAYTSMPMPKRGDEAWRFANLKKLDLEAFVPAEPAAPEMTNDLVRRSRRLEESEGKLVFVNEELAEARPPRSEGVLCMPLMEAVEKHGQLLQEHFMTQDAPLGSAKFALLHKSRTRSGLFLYVPPGVNVSLPIEVYHWIAGRQTSIFPHTLVVTGANATVTVVDYFQNADRSSPGFCCGVVDLVAGAGSRINYVACQLLNDQSSHIQVSSTLASANADVKALQVQLGARWVRGESVSHLNGKGANSDMLSVSVPSDDQEIDQRTLQHHAEPHTTSDLLYKNALYDRGRSIFAGLIMVDDGAHHTDAFQTCRNLLLSDEAEANAMPGLEINADQVKCSHGATSGAISEDELFYFNARGIPADTAKKLITMGFTAEVLEKFGDTVIERLVTEMLEAKFKELD